MQYKNGNNGKPIELDKEYELVNCFELLFEKALEPANYNEKLEIGFELLTLNQKE